MIPEQEFKYATPAPQQENGASAAAPVRVEPKLPPLYSRTPEYEVKQRLRHRVRLAVGLGTVLALFGTGWYAWPWFNQQSVRLARIPEIQDALSVVEQRATDVEEELRLWRREWAGLRKQLAGYDQKIDHGLAKAKTYATSASTEVERRTSQRLAVSTAQLDREIEKLRSTQSAEAASSAALRWDVEQLRGEMENMRLVASHNRSEAQDGIRSIQQRLDHNENQWTALSDRLHRDRIDFELMKDVPREVAPGILLGLTGVDVRHSRYKGWMRLAPMGRTLWFQNQGIGQPVVFYQDGDQPGQLVITSVRENQAVGYFLLPNSAQPAEKNRRGPGA